MMTSFSIKAALFDMDGTILDSSVIWNNAARDTLTKLGYVSDSRIALDTYDMFADGIASYLKTNYPITETYDQVYEITSRMISDFYTDVALLKQGAKCFLQLLKKHNVPLVLVSASPDYYIIPALKRNGVLDLFDQVISSSTWVGGKNRPEVFLHILSLLNIQPQYAWLFEDSFSSIRTANSLGIHTCGIKDYAAVFREDIIQEESEIYLQNWSEISKLPFMPLSSNS